MVKNTFGGNKHKSQARKFTNAKSSNKLRIAEEQGEIYAVVTKMLGNGMFHALGIDQIKRLGHIRGKFSGRGKRDNNVEIGKWVLLGEREWDIQKPKDLKQKTETFIKCDLLEVYNDLDKERLKESVDDDWNILINENIKDKPCEKNSLVDFTNESQEEYNTILNELNNNKINVIEFNTNKNTNTNDNANDWIDIDDI